MEDKYEQAKFQQTLVKVKFRRKLVEQFGNRSFPENPVAANMTAVWLSPPKGINSLSSQLKYQFPTLIEMIKVGMNKLYLIRERLLYFSGCLDVWVRHQYLKTQAEMPRGPSLPLVSGSVMEPCFEPALTPELYYQMSQCFAQLRAGKMPLDIKVHWKGDTLGFLILNTLAHNAVSSEPKCNKSPPIKVTNKIILN